MTEVETSVFVVQHLHVQESGCDDVKMIGVYASRRAAEDAAQRVGKQPGFRDWPDIIDPARDGNENGFYIDEYRLGRDHWTEGYITVP